MIKIKFLVIGSLKEKYFKDMQNEYLKRLQRYCDIEIKEFKEIPFDSNKLNTDLIESIKSNESKDILNLIKKDDILILLDLHGNELDSIKFSNILNNYISSLRGNIIIVIGGPLGVSKELILRSNLRLKLTNLTFTHQFCRIITLEQIYRAFKIINHESYHY